MRKLRTILITCVVASSLFAAAGTAWGRSDGVQRGTAWTDGETPVVFDPFGVSWEGLPISLAF
jgi:hypothetical protein